MKFRVGRRLKHSMLGDTLVEVMFAIGIFSMVAITIVSVMSSGSSNMQTSLETTMARNEIDAQAEALRFIHKSYVAEKNDGISGPYTAAWNEIASLAEKNTELINSGDSALAALTDDKVNLGLFVYQPTQCRTIYDMDALSTEHAFVIDIRNIASGNFVEKKADDNLGTMFVPASVYPRLYYTTAYGAEDISLSFNGRTLNSVEGLYVIGIHDPGGTILSKAVDGVDAIVEAAPGNQAYYDFYIRSCWYGYGKSIPTTISTLIRLYDPDVEVDNNQAIDRVLTYDWSGHDCENIYTHAIEPCPVYQEQKPAKVDSDEPSKFVVGNKLPDGYSVGMDTPIGWSTDPNARCSSSGLKKVGDFVEVGGKKVVDGRVTTLSPFVTLYPVWNCKYTIKYETDYNSSVTGVSDPRSYSNTVINAMPTYENGEWVFRTQLQHIGLTADDPAPTYPFATFNGWKCSSLSGCPDTEVHNSAYTIVFKGNKPNDMTLKFKADRSVMTYSISYDLNSNGDSVSPNSIAPSTVAVGPSTITSCTTVSCIITLNSTRPTRTGYKFLGWARSANATEALFNISESGVSSVIVYNTLPNITLYAVWQRVQPQIEQPEIQTFYSGTSTSDCTMVHFYLRWISGDLDGILVADKLGRNRVVVSPDGIVVRNESHGAGQVIAQTSGQSSVKDGSSNLLWQVLCNNDGPCNDHDGQGVSWENDDVHGEEMIVPICRGWTYTYHVRNTDNNGSLGRRQAGLMIEAGGHLFTLTPNGHGTYYYHGPTNVNYWMPFVIDEGNRLSSRPFLDSVCYYDRSGEDCSMYHYRSWYRGSYDASYDPTVEH